MICKYKHHVTGILLFALRETKVDFFQHSWWRLQMRVQFSKRGQLSHKCKCTPLRFCISFTYKCLFGLSVGPTAEKCAPSEQSQTVATVVKTRHSCRNSTKKGPCASQLKLSMLESKSFITLESKWPFLNESQEIGFANRYSTSLLSTYFVTK